MDNKLTEMFFKIQGIAITCFLILASAGFFYLKTLKTEQANIISNSVKESVFLTDYRGVSLSIAQSANSLFENVILVGENQVELINIFNSKNKSIFVSTILIPLFFNDNFGLANNTLVFIYSTKLYWLSVFASLLFFIVAGYILFVRFKKGYLEAQEVQAKINLQEKLGILASQVAHDIRSPLAALDMVTNNLKELPEDKRLLIRNSIGRIRDIANDLLNRNRASLQNDLDLNAPEEKKSTELIQSLIDPLITEKRLQFRSKLDIEITAQIDSSGYGLFAAIQPTEFKRVLSNLINNSVEAFTNSGVVTITLKPDQKNVLVEIKDNGKGIPEAILAKLGARGETHGKEGGSGLGYYHAKKSVEAWGGTLTISSQVGKGTIVTINLPQTKIPHWFVPKLLIYPAHQIVVLDDDSSIHQIWQGRFDSAIDKKHNVNLLHFSTEEEIKNWKQEQQATVAKHVTYLVDYELIGQKKSGLDIIETLCIAQDAILVTSRYEEEGIRRRCEQLGIKMIPKGLAGFVPIEFAAEIAQKPATNYETCDCVLIDDDALVRMTWGFAAKDAGKALRVFSSPKEFFELVAKINPKTPIYIDSHLGEGLHGEEIAQELFEKYGFCEIYLATGYAASDFDLSKLPYLKGIIGKDNPWV